VPLHAKHTGFVTRFPLAGVGPRFVARYIRWCGGHRAELIDVVPCSASGEGCPARPLRFNLVHTCSAVVVEHPYIQAVVVPDSTVIPSAESGKTEVSNRMDLSLVTAALGVFSAYTRVHRLPLLTTTTHRG
jgi:hypothetical protein